MPKIFQGLLVASSLLLSACTTWQTRDSLAANGENAKAPSDSVTAASDETEKPPANILEKEVSSEDVEINIEKPYKSSYGEIALDYNERVEQWIKYFQGRGRRYMDQYLARSTRYLPMMKNVLRENGL